MLPVHSPCWIEGWSAGWLVQMNLSFVSSWIHTVFFCFQLKHFTLFCAMFRRFTCLPTRVRTTPTTWSNWKKWRRELRTPTGRLEAKFVETFSELGHKTHLNSPHHTNQANPEDPCKIVAWNMRESLGSLFQSIVLLGFLCLTSHAGDVGDPAFREKQSPWNVRYSKSNYSGCVSLSITQFILSMYHSTLAKCNIYIIYMFFRDANFSYFSL